MGLGRLRRGLFGHDSDDENVEIGDENAWWAARENIENAPQPKKRGRDASTEPSEESGNGSGAFDSYFSSDTLYRQLDDPPEQPVEPDPDSPFAILGVGRDASWSEICSRHRQLAKQYHPDGFTHLGEEEVATAADTMAEINVAFSELKRILHHGGSPIAR